MAYLGNIRRGLLHEILKVIYQNGRDKTYDTDWITRRVAESGYWSRGGKPPRTPQRTVNSYFSKGTELFRRCGQNRYCLRKEWHNIPALIGFVVPHIEEVKETSVERDRRRPNKVASSALPRKQPKKETLSFPQQILAEEADEFIEGAVERVSINAYERNQDARAACLAKYGTRCGVCRRKLDDEYGDVAAGYIHVHHIKPLSESKGQYVVVAIRDLRPVCPNCHTVIHLRRPPYTIDEVKRMIRNARRKHRQRRVSNKAS